MNLHYSIHSLTPLIKSLSDHSTVLSVHQELILIVFCSYLAYKLAAGFLNPLSTTWTHQLLDGVFTYARWSISISTAIWYRCLVHPACYPRLSAVFQLLWFYGSWGYSSTCRSDNSPVSPMIDWDTAFGGQTAESLISVRIMRRQGELCDQVITVIPYVISITLFKVCNKRAYFLNAFVY